MPKQLTYLLCRCLDLQMNSLSNFQEILKLGNIRTLKHLNLMKNDIRYVQLPDCQPNEAVTIFENLIEINLKENPIENEVSTFTFN